MRGRYDEDIYIYIYTCGGSSVSYASDLVRTVTRDSYRVFTDWRVGEVAVVREQLANWCELDRVSRDHQPLYMYAIRAESRRKITH